MTADDGAILQLNSRRSMSRLLLMILSSNSHLTVICRNLSLIEKHLYLGNFFLITSTQSQLVGSSIIATNDFILRSLAASLIIRNTETYHIHTHIRRRLVWIRTIDTLEESIEYRINLNITIIVDSNLIICLQMERVDHVDIIEIGSSCLVCNIHRMLQWKIPNWESLKLGISCTHTTLVLIIQLAEANSHFATTRTRSCHDNQRALSFYIIILSETVIRSNQVDIMRIALDEIMTVGFDTITFQALLESCCSRLTVVMSNHNRTHHKTTVLELATKTENILIISDTQVGTLFILLNVCSTNHDNNFNAIADFLKHTELTIWLETRQYATCMMVIEKLSS